MLGTRRGAAITASLVLVALWMPIASGQPLARVAGVAQGLPRFGGCKTFFSRTVQGAVRPRSIVLACGDGNFYLTGIAWSRWGMREALGVGVGHQNNCLPDCASVP